MTAAAGPTRAERRRNTEQRILAAARELFAERGFERTTIRAVASAAQVDPALVMQYFGSKQELFSQAVRISVAGAEDRVAGAEDRPRTGGPEALTDSLLASLGMKIGGLPEASLAMLRSMLTHPEAAEAARTALDHQITELAAAISAGHQGEHQDGHHRAEDARLHAALAVATMVGVTIGHQLLGIDDLRRASPEEIAAALRPALHALVTGAE
ncbi:TetR family transcriptional regulator [Streptomyces sp. NBS 14/10]|uniref:TetR/AcrR family transcriptional regulator n=1 Tax=Streptomyces sp. NBS 14/10 TaxID=1945643 RepID=UPI000B7E8C41|nr:TetR/AcrR family transcriptional regulator [Streptomyces sp. NBS 14/10]KAK1178825.1 TetR family transcriptional regulator [Streptomyces sp. NBS 14/10]NUP40955.1 TetR family transcriptional regulator [Streptomyces sp.]NUS84223.1 TetR family transcriptional regulator [Streptomyces sp.]